VLRVDAEVVVVLKVGSSVFVVLFTSSSKYVGCLCDVVSKVEAAAVSRSSLDVMKVIGLSAEVVVALAVVVITDIWTGGPYRNCKKITSIAAGECFASVTVQVQYTIWTNCSIKNALCALSSKYLFHSKKRQKLYRN
jgi:hypothetical protein